MSKKNFIPKYAYIPLISAVLFNIVVYNGSKIITNNFFHHDFSNIIDSYIPFLKIFIIIYILAYLHWIIGFIIISKENSKTCYNVMSAEIIAKLICLFFFYFGYYNIIKLFLSYPSSIQTIPYSIYCSFSNP